MKKPDYVALIDMELPTGNSGGIMAGVDVEDGRDHIQCMIEMIETIKRTSPFATGVTFVTVHHSKPSEVYIHPPMAQQAASDGSMPGPKGPMWFQLVMGVNLVGEEE